MDIYVISLTNAVERRAAIARQLKNLGLAFEFFDACTGADGYAPFFDTYDASTYKVHSRRNALPGEIGCYASHLSLWKRCIKKNQPIVIIEDDALLTDSIPAALHAAEKIISACGYLRLEPNKQSRRRPRRYYPVGHVDEFAVNFLARIALCTTGYVVHPEAARRFVSGSATLLAPVDRYLARPWTHGQPLYLLTPAAVQRQENTFPSGIKTAEGAAAKLMSLGLLLRISFFKGAYFFRRVWFNATTGKRSRARVRAALAKLN